MISAWKNKKLSVLKLLIMDQQMNYMTNDTEQRPINQESLAAFKIRRMSGGWDRGILILCLLNSEIFSAHTLISQAGPNLTEAPTSPYSKTHLLCTTVEFFIQRYNFVKLKL